MLASLLNINVQPVSSDRCTQVLLVLGQASWDERGAVLFAAAVFQDLDRPVGMPAILRLAGDEKI